MLDRFLTDWFAESGKELPNKFTLYMGERIRTAREEAGMSQEQLARMIYKRRATLSDIENGKSEADTSTFVLMSHYLMKPFEYFLPPYSHKEITKEDLSPAEKEVVMNLRYHVASDHFLKLVVSLIKAIGKFDIDHFVMEQYETSKAILENEELMKQDEEKRKRR